MLPNLDCACYIDGSLKVDGSDCTSNDECPCDTNGLCSCGIGYTGEKCDKCVSGYYDFDGNDLDGSATCSGKFILNIAYKFWHSIMTYNIIDCSCHFDGSLKTDGSVCISTDPCPCSSSGTCNCGIGFKGEKCDECEPGYYDLDENESTSGVSCTGKFPCTHEILFWMNNFPIIL